MTKTKLNFYCPSATVKVIDEMAAADHRDRTSMLNKMVDFYLNSHRLQRMIPEANGTKPTPPPTARFRPTRKKAEAR